MHGASGWLCRLCQVKSFFASGSHPSGTAFFWLGVAPRWSAGLKGLSCGFCHQACSVPWLGLRSLVPPLLALLGLSLYLQFSSVSLPSRSSDSRGPRYEICTFTVSPSLSSYLYTVPIFVLYIYSTQVFYTGLLWCKWDSFEHFQSKEQAGKLILVRVVSQECTLSRGHFQTWSNWDFFSWYLIETIGNHNSNPAMWRFFFSNWPLKPAILEFVLKVAEDQTGSFHYLAFSDTEVNSLFFPTGSGALRNTTW